MTHEKTHRDEEPEDVDAVFEAIVAGFDTADVPSREPSAEPSRESSRESSGEPGGESIGAAAGSGALGTTDDSAGHSDPGADGGWDDLVQQAATQEAADEAAHDEAVEQAERFVPPAPPPIPRSDALGTLAWGGAVGAPALYIVTAALGFTWESWQLALLVGAFLGGFGPLVSRMRQDHDEPDDGAVV